MKRLFYVLLTLVMVSSMLLPAVPASADNRRPGGGLSKHDRDLLAEARVEGKTSVTLLIASLPGENKSVTNDVITLGGVVRYQDNSLDYVRAIVPIDAVEKIAQIAGIQAVNLDEIIPLVDPAPEKIEEPVAVDPPGPTTPPVNGYMPTGDIGAPQFVAEHPTWDGRGVKIGILDTGIDLLTPELQTAKLLDGTPVRKIIDWVNFNDPLSGVDPSWVNMQTQVKITNGSFVVNSVTYTGAPANGQFRFGIFSEASIDAGSEYTIKCGNDLNRNGLCNESFAVLWRTTDNTVWVDTNADHSFAGELGMTDYKVNYDIGIFGTDNPATPVRETVPFVVQTDGKDKYVNIGVVGGAHATHVAGIAAGKGFFGGAFNGAAPEAQIVSVRVCLFGTGCTSHGMIEGMIYATKMDNVDVVNMSIGGLPALNDGNNTRALIYNRLIDQTKAQMFFSAGNSGPGINTVGDPSVATKVMSVGGYVTKNSWLLNYGANAAKDEQLFVFSSRGPREDGGLKPNIVAPGSAVSSIPAWQPVAGQCLPYTCPPGYAMYNGTSMSAPEATGGAALLISAAKQTGVQYKPDQLRQAINSSARFIPDASAHEQGNGLFQVGAAWDLLATNIKTAEISSFAPVNTILSGYLAIPNFGPGIYEREGWSAGDSDQRTIIFVRTQGGSMPITYNLSWVGNDGTFSSAASIDLPLNTPVDLSVDVAPSTPGVHSALLYLDDPSSAGYEYQVLNTVVASEKFNVGNNFTITHTGSAVRPEKTTYFFYVPANTPAFKVDVTTLTGRVRTLRQHPYGVPYDSTSTTAYCSAGANCQSSQPAGTISRTASNPTPGVWEVTIDTSRTSSASPATFSITASILGVDITPATWVVDPALVGTTYNQTFSFTNRFGGFTGGAVGTALGSAFKERPTIANLAQQFKSVDVLAGSTSLSVRIGNPSDPAADLDLYVFKGATLVAYSAGGSAEESVRISNPSGTYTILIDAYSVPSGSTAYDYFDSFANPAFGSVSVTDPSALHPNGDTWSASASVTANAKPASGRFLQGFVQVMSGSSVLGSAEVDLMNVGP